MEKIIIIIVCIIFSISISISGIGFYFYQKSDTSADSPVTSSDIPVTSDPPVTSSSDSPVTSSIIKQYNNNNGAVSGSVYCAGNFENTNGKDKNMQCTAGKNITNGTDLDCNTIYGVGNGTYSYTCMPSLNPYTGNNGSVTGNEYCSGSWESADRKDKNMKCISGKSGSGKALDCGKTYGNELGSLSYICGTIANPYNGNNGSITGNKYCSGNWESADGKDKNMKCISGKSGSGKALDCGKTYGNELGSLSYICGGYS